MCATMKIDFKTSFFFSKHFFNIKLMLIDFPHIFDTFIFYIIYTKCNRFLSMNLMYLAVDWFNTKIDYSLVQIYFVIF